MNMMNSSPLAMPIVNHFPLLESCPKTKRLIISLASKTQCREDMVLALTLSTYSVNLQAVIDVERPNIGRGPVSIFLITVAESGERKSSLAKLLEKPVWEFQERQNEVYKKKLRKHEINKILFEQEKAHLLKSILKMRKKGEESAHLECQLMDLELSAPEKPQKIQLIFEDATPEAIAVALDDDWGNVALVSNEGGAILSGRSIHNLPLLNKLWSSEPVVVNRKSSESFMVDNSRLSISIQAQYSALAKFLKNKGEESRGIGFLARFLVCHPFSTQGTRYIGYHQADEEGYLDYLSTTEEIFTKIQNRIDNDHLDRELIEFSPEAKRYWVDMYNRIESNLGFGGRFEYARDHGSKLAENISRIAALLTYIEKGPGEQVPLDILIESEAISLYFSDVFLKVFDARPNYQKNIDALREFLQNVREDGVRYIRKNKVRQSGPLCIRSKRALDEALSILQSLGEIGIVPASTGLMVVDLYPNYAFDPAMWDRLFMKN